MTGSQAPKRPRLLPCPFCGANPHWKQGEVWYDSLHGDRQQDQVIECPHRCARMEGAPEPVADRWNTRAPQ